MIIHGGIFRPSAQKMQKIFVEKTDTFC